MAFNTGEIIAIPNERYVGELRIATAFALSIDEQRAAAKQEIIWQRRRYEKETDISVGHTCHQPQVQFLSSCLHAYLF